MQNYSPEEVEFYSHSPYVESVSTSSLVFTYDFKSILYQAWLSNKSSTTIKQTLIEYGFNPFSMGRDYPKNLNRDFKRYNAPGSPLEKMKYEAKKQLRPDAVKRKLSITKTEASLVSTGKFCYCNNGLSFSPDFIAELLEAYPEQSIEEGIINAGISLQDVDASMIADLLCSFGRIKGKDPCFLETPVLSASYNRKTLNDYGSDPFVKNVSSKRILLNSLFYDAAAAIASLPIDEILSAFCIPPGLFSFAERDAIKRDLMAMPQVRITRVSDLPLPAQVLKNIMHCLDKIARSEFQRIKALIPGMDLAAKKKLYLFINSLPGDPGRFYSKRRILELLSISRTVFYKSISDPNYTDKEEKRMEKKLRETEDVIKVFEYKGFKKGYRQIYMLMPVVTGKKLSAKKIREIMRENGLSSGIRVSSQSRQHRRELIKERVKPNLLKRMFKLFRPNQVRLTDVTYLAYGKGSKAYGSALLDPVTGVLIAFNLSDRNDLELALETLARADSHPCINGGILHSDQGTLYLSTDFQDKLASMGINQSMSKRGNCLDNAPAESFFGHFKDECPYTECSDLEELTAMVDKYVFYYNNERGLWDRGRMTPLKYEAYLSSMSDEEFKLYLDKEEKKYNEMKAKAAEKAKERAKTLGV